MIARTSLFSPGIEVLQFNPIGLYIYNCSSQTYIAKTNYTESGIICINVH